MLNCSRGFGLQDKKIAAKSSARFRREYLIFSIFAIKMVKSMKYLVMNLKVYICRYRCWGPVWRRCSTRPDSKSMRVKCPKVRTIIFAASTTSSELQDYGELKRLEPPSSVRAHLRAMQLLFTLSTSY